MRAERFSVDNARHFFPFLPVALALGIATYFCLAERVGLALSGGAASFVSCGAGAISARACGHL